MQESRLKSPTHFKLAEMKEENLSAKLTRKIIPGEKGMIGVITLLKDCFVPSHKHESEQITYIVKGALKFLIEGKEFVIREGEMLLIPSNFEHSASALEDTLDIDFFSPLRQDWLSGQDQYLRTNSKE